MADLFRQGRELVRYKKTYDDNRIMKIAFFENGKVLNQWIYPDRTHRDPWKIYYSFNKVPAYKKLKSKEEKENFIREQATYFASVNNMYRDHKRR